MLGGRSVLTVLPAAIQAKGLRVLSNYLSSCSGKRDNEDDDTGDKNNGCPCKCCNCCPCSCHPVSVYDCRKYSQFLPGNTVRPNFSVLPCIPTGIFRCTSEECIGPQGQAGKCCVYRNPEYFSFHHMTYYDMHWILRCFRNPSPDTDRKPT